MDENELLCTGDPYGAIAVWYFDANRDPEKFLRIFEGVAPPIRGMIWTDDGYISDEDEAPELCLADLIGELAMPRRVAPDSDTV